MRKEIFENEVVKKGIIQKKMKEDEDLWRKFHIVHILVTRKVPLTAK